MEEEGEGGNVEGTLTPTDTTERHPSLKSNIIGGGRLTGTSTIIIIIKGTEPFETEMCFL